MQIWYAQCTLCSRPWRSHRCSSGRRDFPGAALGPGIDMPLVVQRHMHSSGVKVVDISVVAQMQSPMVLVVQKTIRFLSCSPLKRWSTSLLGRSSRFHVCCLCEDRLHSCTCRIRSWTRSLTCPLCSTTMPWLSVQQTAKVPQLHCSFKVADVPVEQVVLVPQVLLRSSTSL